MKRKEDRFLPNSYTLNRVTEMGNSVFFNSNTIQLHSSFQNFHFNYIENWNFATQTPFQLHSDLSSFYFNSIGLNFSFLTIIFIWGLSNYNFTVK